MLCTCVMWKIKRTRIIRQKKSDVEVHNKNLVTVKTQQRRKRTSNLRFSLWNARSVTQKVSTVCDIVTDTKCDVLGLTETWLSGGAEDSAVIGSVSSELKGYRVISHPRTSRRGGGIAVIVRQSLDPKVNKRKQFNTFEMLDVSISRGKDLIRLLLIYRPPPSKTNKFTVKERTKGFSCGYRDK